MISEIFYSSALELSDQHVLLKIVHLQTLVITRMMILLFGNSEKRTLSTVIKIIIQILFHQSFENQSIILLVNIIKVIKQYKFTLLSGISLVHFFTF